MSASTTRAGRENHPPENKERDIQKHSQEPNTSNLFKIKSYTNSDQNETLENATKTSRSARRRKYKKLQQSFPEPSPNEVELTVDEPKKLSRNMRRRLNKKLFQVSAKLSSNEPLRNSNVEYSQFNIRNDEKYKNEFIVLSKNHKAIYQNETEFKTNECCRNILKDRENNSRICQIGYNQRNEKINRAHIEIIDEPISTPQCIPLTRASSEKATTTENIESTNVSCKSVLVNLCQKKIELLRKQRQELDKSLIKLNSSCIDQETRDRLQLEFDQIIKKQIDASVRFAKFTCELFKEKKVQSRMVEMCLTHLLKFDKEETLRCTCEIIKDIGQNLNLDELFEELQRTLSKKCEMDNAVLTMISETVELKNNNRIPRSPENKQIFLKKYETIPCSYRYSQSTKHTEEEESSNTSSHTSNEQNNKSCQNKILQKTEKHCSSEQNFENNLCSNESKKCHSTKIQKNIEFSNTHILNEQQNNDSYQNEIQQEPGVLIPNEPNSIVMIENELNIDNSINKCIREGIESSNIHILDYQQSNDRYKNEIQLEPIIVIKPIEPNEITKFENELCSEKSIIYHHTAEIEAEGESLNVHITNEQQSNDRYKNEIQLEPIIVIKPIEPNEITKFENELCSEKSIIYHHTAEIEAEGESLNVHITNEQQSNDRYKNEIQLEPIIVIKPIEPNEITKFENELCSEKSIFYHHTAEIEAEGESLNVHITKEQQNNSISNEIQQEPIKLKQDEPNKTITIKNEFYLHKFYAHYSKDIEENDVNFNIHIFNESQNNDTYENEIQKELEMVKSIESNLLTKSPNEFYTDTSIISHHTTETNINNDSFNIYITNEQQSKDSYPNEIELNTDILKLIAPDEAIQFEHEFCAGTSINTHRKVEIETEEESLNVNITNEQQNNDYFQNKIQKEPEMLIPIESNLIKKFENKLHPDESYNDHTSTPEIETHYESSYTNICSLNEPQSENVENDDENETLLEETYYTACKSNLINISIIILIHMLTCIKFGINFVKKCYLLAVVIYFSYFASDSPIIEDNTNQLLDNNDHVTQSLNEMHSDTNMRQTFKKHM